MRPSLIKSLTLWDVVAMNIVAVVSLRWIARSARIGAPSLVLWVLACLTFFVPLALVLAELSSRHPEQGGIYAWARRAFGPVHGFICGWCLWVNNLFYFPSLLLFGAANATLAFGSGGAAIADSRAYSLAFALGWLWICTLVNIVGWRAGKWVQHVGNIATWIPAALLSIGGAISFATFGSATSFAPSQLLPRDEVWGTLSLWSAMCFAFSGIEISSMVGQEIRDPRRTIARGILLSGIAISAIYILGSASVLIAVPSSELAERSGIADAVDLVSGRLGLAGLGALTGLLLAIGAIGCTSSWIAGAARVPFAAGVDLAMPSAFAQLHPRYRTPHVALVVQALATTALFLVSVFLSIGGGQTSIQEAYDIMVNLTILVYFVPYLYLFASFIKLRRTETTNRLNHERDQPREGKTARQINLESDQPRDGVTTTRINGGMWLVAACGLSATLISIGLVLVPPVGTENRLNYEVNVIGQAALLLAIGMAFYYSAKRRGADKSEGLSPRNAK
jgi:amino acid transporter